MAEYEVVREVQNLCANNQMRDVFFDEIETDDPVEWVRREIKGKEVNLTVDQKADGGLTRASARNFCSRCSEAAAGFGKIQVFSIFSQVWACIYGVIVLR